MTPDTINEINENLDELGADFSIGMTVEVPVELTFSGGDTYETHLKMKVTEDGYETCDPDAQVERIVNEAREHVEAPEE